MAFDELEPLRARIAELEEQLLGRHALALEEKERARQTLSVLHNTEQRFRALFDSNVIGIIEINEDRILDANQSFLEMSGHSREALLAGKLFWRELTPAKYKRIDEAAHERAIQHGCFQPFEKEIYRKDGTLVPVWVGGVLLNPPPNWTCMAFVLDLSERKILEEQFHTAQKLKSLGLLSSVIAHDFNNLLTTMIGNATLCLKELPPEHPAYEHVTEILRASNLASGLTSQLVGYSSKPRNRAQSLDLSHLVREIGDLIELPLSRNVELNWNLAPQLPAVQGDAYLIQQILMNLVINASDAVGDHSGTIRIVTHCRDYREAELQAMTMGSGAPAGQYVAVEVHDNGCGMTEEVQSKIFDALFTTKVKGRGLGLAATLGIVKTHHGAINVRSKVGVGTTFTVLFPVAIEAADLTQVPQNEVSLKGHGTVLVIDDEPSVRKLAETTLSKYGYRVLMAENGRDGLDLYRAQADCISLVIMDLSMPVMDGEKAMNELATIAPATPVLVSSGFEGEHSSKYLEKYAFLQKPYTAKQLAERVKEMHSPAR